MGTFPQLNRIQHYKIPLKLCNAKTFWRVFCFYVGVDLSFHSWQGPGEIRDFAFLMSSKF